VALSVDSAVPVDVLAEIARAIDAVAVRAVDLTE
jgi:D-3-phosphoglycerate dehydrogenase